MRRNSILKNSVNILLLLTVDSNCTWPDDCRERFDFLHYTESHNVFDEPRTIMIRRRKKEKSILNEMKIYQINSDRLINAIPRLIIGNLHLNPCRRTLFTIRTSLVSHRETRVRNKKKKIHFSSSSIIGILTGFILLFFFLPHKYWFTFILVLLRLRELITNNISIGDFAFDIIKKKIRREPRA